MKTTPSLQARTIVRSMFAINPAPLGCIVLAYVKIGKYQAAEIARAKHEEPNLFRQYIVTIVDVVPETMEVKRVRHLDKKFRQQSYVALYVKNLKHRYMLQLKHTYCIQCREELAIGTCECQKHLCEECGIVNDVGYVSCNLCDKIDVRGDWEAKGDEENEYSHSDTQD